MLEAIQYPLDQIIKEIDNKFAKNNMNIKAIVILTELKYTLVELNLSFDWPSWLYKKVVLLSLWRDNLKKALVCK